MQSVFLLKMDKTQFFTYEIFLRRFFTEFLQCYYEYIVGAVIFLMAVVSFFVTLLTKKSVTKSVNSFKEVFDLKTKYLNADTRVRPSQSFSEEVTDYVLNENTNELVVSPLPKNVQDYIDSHIDTALERALERFMEPKNVLEEDVVNDFTSSVNDLTYLAEAMEKAEYYREKLGLPDSYSVGQIYSAVDKHAQDLKIKIKEVQNDKEKKVEPSGE